MSNYKHNCSLSGHPNTNRRTTKTQSFIANIVALWRKLTRVSPYNYHSKSYFRTRAAIELERKRHLENDFPCIIHPFSLFRLAWKCWMLFVLFFSLILNPLDIAFFPIATLPDLTLVEIIIDLICIIDIVITFFTGYADVKTKTVILDPTMIAKRYIRSTHFYLNVLSSIPAALICIGHPSKHMIVDFLYLLKIFRLYDFFIFTYRTISIYQRTVLSGLILLVIIIIGIILHWITCMIYAIPHMAKLLLLDDPDDYWMDMKGSTLTNTDSALAIYLQCFFRASCVFFNVDHGGAIPKTYIDLSLSISTAIIGYVLMALLLILILQYVCSGGSAQSKYQEIVSQVQEYMRYKQLPCDIQNRIMSCYEYRFQKKYFREDVIKATMSERLRREINVYNYRRLIDTVSLFKGVPDQVVVDIVNCLKREIFLPNDIIMKAHTIGDCMYFLSSGTVCVITPTGREVCHLDDGAYFGEIALLQKDEKRIATVYALEICEVYRLDRKHFQYCFTSNTELCKKLQRVADERREQTALIEDLQNQYLT